MYQSVFYDRTTYEYHLRDDVKGWKTFKYQPTLYQLDPDGEFETLDGQSVSPIKKMDNWKDPKYFEKDVDKDTRVLVDFYYESDETPSYHNLVYLDIECEIAGALTQDSVRNPQGKITAIAVYDNTFISNVSDKDVFDFVKDIAQSKRISFSKAAEYCYDDFDVAKMLELDY